MTKRDACYLVPTWYNIANANPIRYRGYYYDNDLGLYYLQSRYYDSHTGRFINADGYITTNAVEPLSYNMFVYCRNNPIKFSDPSGYFVETLEWFHSIVEITVKVVVDVYTTTTMAVNQTILNKFPDIELDDFSSNTVSFLYLILSALDDVDIESYDQNIIKFAWDISVDVVFDGASGYVGVAMGAKVGVLVGECVGTAVSPGVGSIVGPVVGVIVGGAVGGLLSWALTDTKDFVKGWVSYE